MDEKKPKNIKKKKMWAYFAPDGYIQVRSLSLTKCQAKEEMPRSGSTSWRDYEKEGFKLHKVEVDIKVITK